jgi:hypothetical protein
MTLVPGQTEVVMGKSMPPAGRAPRTPGHQRPPITTGKLGDGPTAGKVGDKVDAAGRQPSGDAPAPQGGKGLLTVAFPLTADGDEREDTAAQVGAAVASVFAARELALLAALTAAVKRTLPLSAVTAGSLARLRRDIATTLATAEQQAKTTVTKAGVPWDYQPVIPAAAGAAFLAGTIPSLIPAGQLPPSPDLAEAFGGQTAASVKETIKGVSARVFRDIPDLYQQAVQQAIAAMPPGQTGIGYSIPRVQAAQSALDQLTAKGLTGFTDRRFCWGAG